MNYTPLKRANICFDCKNAVPDDCGHGCEWSRKFEPVPGWTAEPSVLRSGGCLPTASWHITACPKFDPDDGYVPLKKKPKSHADYVRAMSSEELAEFLCAVCDDADRIKDMSDEVLAGFICKQKPMRSWPAAVLDIFYADQTITGTHSWLKWLKAKKTSEEWEHGKPQE